MIVGGVFFILIGTYAAADFAVILTGWSPRNEGDHLLENQKHRGVEMDTNEIRKILGMLAGALAGRKAGKGESLGEFTGGLSGAVGGLFSAILVNSLEKLSQGVNGESQVSDIELHENVAEFRGLMNGLVLAAGVVLGTLEGIGLTDEQMYLSLGVEDKAGAEALLVRNRSSVQSSIEQSVASMYESMEKQIGPLWAMFQVAKDKEDYLKWLRLATNRVIDRRS